MALGGKRPGAGRKKGSTNRPVIRDFFTDADIKALIVDIKIAAKTDNRLKQWLGDQIFGKATQPVEGSGANGEIVVKIVNYGDKPSA